jgi:hypothetical protein
MGAKYRSQKHERKLAHVNALISACADLRVEIPTWWRLDPAKLGFKKLGAMRENLIEAAFEQGVDAVLIYEAARKYAPIPARANLRKCRRTFRVRRSRHTFKVVASRNRVRK